MSADIRAQIEHVLRQYPAEFRPRTIEFPAHAAGFSGAVIARVECEAGTVCVRGWPPGSLPIERIGGLHRLLGHIRQQGVCQVAVPLAARNRATVVAGGDRLWQVEPWMPGLADFHDCPSHARLAAAVNCLARWHRAADSFQCSPTEARWFSRAPSAVSPAIAERSRMITEWLSGGCAAIRQRLAAAGKSELDHLARQIVAAFERTAPHVARLLRSVGQVRVRLQPCLRDVWHDHVLFAGEEVTGLIDPSASRTETVAVDLSRLLGSLVGDEAAAWDHALHVYGQTAELTLDELALVPVLDQSGVLLSGMTWLERCYLRSPPLQPGPRLLERLRGIVRRLDCLAGTD